ncbi:MAG: DUF1592 domain-containing protein [Woeseiaceae bacterium]|nr:DUF1592 domain-containing protein [Woeseiaceae bacterium]
MFRFLVLPLLAGSPLLLGPGPVSATEPAAAEAVAGYRLLLDRHCVTCHNRALRTAGVMLDLADVGDVAADPALWERVVTKLSLRAMPPVGAPRPGEADYRALLAYLRAELDRRAQTAPDPGRAPIRRLNRTEYANAIRDLLDLDIDAAALLPADNVGQGFDTVAEALSLSPLLMERYLFAAGRVSRLAVGPGAVRPGTTTYQVSADLVQAERASEELPFGSRGGTAVRHYFPLDGEYTLGVKLQRNQEGYIRGLKRAHRLDVRIDNERIALLTVGGETHGRSGPLFTSNQNPMYAGDPAQAGYEFGADEALEVRVTVRAGPRVVGVTFVDSGALPTGVLEPALTLSDIGSYKGGEPAIASVTVTGPFDPGGPGATPSRERIFSCRPGPAASAAAAEACAADILGRLARLAYRRPIGSPDLEPLLALYRVGVGDGADFDGGIQLALEGLLATPDFLLRIERDPAGAEAGAAYPVSDLELASRLSFFLWNSIPDAELLDVAERGVLRDAAVLDAQVRRMLADARFDRFIGNFGDQWLAVRNVDIATPNPRYFPEFDEELRIALKEEMRLWFASQVREDRAVEELLTSDTTFVNGRLARHYGMDGVRGERYRPVAVNRPERSGVLGKGGLLLATSYNNRTSPVLRGKWVLENLLDMPPPPPPPDVPALEVTDAGGEALTLRQAMEQHRANIVCAGCHKLMDPIGFALEHFDAIGAYRVRYADADAPVDASGILFDGTGFSDTREFRSRLEVHSDWVAHTVVKKLLTYALGRGLEHYDQPVVRDIVRNGAPAQQTWSSLIMGVVRSVPFQYRRAQQ